LGHNDLLDFPDTWAPGIFFNNASDRDGITVDIRSGLQQHIPSYGYRILEHFTRYTDGTPDRNGRFTVVPDDTLALSPILIISGSATNGVSADLWTLEIAGAAIVKIYGKRIKSFSEIH